MLFLCVNIYVNFSLFREINQTFLAFFLLVLPSRPPPRGEVEAWSIDFSESVLTMKEGILTRFFPTLSYFIWRNHKILVQDAEQLINWLKYLMCLCLMRTRAWWTELARLSLKTLVWSLRSINLWMVRPKT